MNIISKKYLFFLLSGLIIVPGIISLILWGLRPGIEFTGGSLLELKFEQNQKSTHSTSSGLTLSEAKYSTVPGEVEASNIKDQIQQIIKEQKIEAGSIQSSGENSYMIRMKPIDKEQNQKLQEGLKEKFGEVEEVSFETVGPSIGKEITENAIKALIIAAAAIIGYTAFAFRNIKPYSSLRFGVCAIIAVLHDSLILIGTFSLLGHFLGVEVDSLFITALLSVMGFSVHDTIVVFDRVRENAHKMPRATFSQVVNESILQTLVRSIANSLTILFTLFAILLFGGETIRWFVVALLIGVASGTYSSTFTAIPLLVVWHEKFAQKGE